MYVHTKHISSSQGESDWLEDNLNASVTVIGLGTQASQSRCGPALIRGLVREWTCDMLQTPGIQRKVTENSWEIIFLTFNLRIKPRGKEFSLSLKVMKWNCEA